MQRLARLSPLLYGQVVTLAALAALEALARAGLRIGSPAAVYLWAVAYAALCGGLVSGLVSAALATAYGLYFLIARDNAAQGPAAIAVHLAGLAVAPLIIAGAMGVLRRQTEKTARLEGVLLAARTMQHRMNNQLAIAVGHAELLAANPRLPPDLRTSARAAADGAMAASELLAKLQRVVRLQEEPAAVLGTMINVEESMEGVRHPPVRSGPHRPA
jgi:hypothetical protein